MSSFYFYNQTSLPFLIEYWKLVPPQSKNFLEYFPTTSLYFVILEPNTHVKLFSYNNSYYISSLFHENDILFTQKWLDNGFTNKKISYIENIRCLKIHNYDKDFICNINENNEIIISSNESYTTILK
jgi:hypothetical protein